LPDCAAFIINTEIEGWPRWLPSISHFETEEITMSVKSQEKNIMFLSLRKEAGPYERAA
jgi:hypothetical protein